MTGQHDIFHGRRVYLCGDMTAPDARKTFEVAESEAKRLGASYVCNPYKTLDMFKYRTYEQKLRWCLHQITTGELSTKQGSGFDFVLLLDGWRDSDAARFERDVAYQCGIKCREFTTEVGE